MKKTYQKPEAELIKFDSTEIILDQGQLDGSMTGNEGIEDW